jgi:hypothetical protein
VRTRVLAGGAVVSGALLIAISFAGLVFADYTPSDPPYEYGVGSGGAKVQDQGTVLDESDAAAAWNIWTSTSKLSLGTSGCGSTTSCIIYANDGATLTNTSCVIPQVPDGAWAVAHILAGSYRSIPSSDCNLGSSTYPIFVVAIDDEGSWSSSDKKLHVARHEVGHALMLGDTSQSCWDEWGYLLPLMHNSSANCSSGGLSFPQNYSATYNEALYAVIRNDW